MNRLALMATIIVGLLVVVVLALVAGQVGGITIRSASRTHIIGSLSTANETILPGVPIQLTVESDEALTQTGSVLLLRLPSTSLVVSEVSPQELFQQEFTVEVPCGVTGDVAAGSSQARFVLVDNASQAVLAQSDPLELLPVGRDCAF